MHPLDVAAHFLGFVAGVAQTLHRGPQLGIGLGDLAQQFRLALFQIQDGLIASLFGLVQALGQMVQFLHVAPGHAGKAVQQPIAEPTGGESDLRRNR